MGRDTNFYYSFLVLPAEKRRAIVAVWDFCRAVDDAVDEASSAGAGGGKTPAEALSLWRQELAACFGGGEPRTEQGRALAPLIPIFRLQKQHFDALIEGVEMDVTVHRYATFEELYEYCIRVASAVGLICLEIFGASSAAARQYATDLGVALQLTNILRDVPLDLARGRIYIPLEDFTTCGCTEDDLRRAARGGGIQSGAVRRLLEHQGARARAYYARAARGLPRAERRRLVAAEIMGAVYRAILARIEARGYDVFDELVRIPRPRRALIAARVWVQTMVRP